MFLQFGTFGYTFRNSSKSAGFCGCGNYQGFSSGQSIICNNTCKQGRIDERYNPFRQTHRSRRRWTHRLVKMFVILVIVTPQFSFSKSPLLALHIYVYRPLVQLLSPLAVYWLGGKKLLSVSCNLVSRYNNWITLSLRNFSWIVLSIICSFHL